MCGPKCEEEWDEFAKALELKEPPLTEAEWTLAKEIWIKHHPNMAAAVNEITERILKPRSLAQGLGQTAPRSAQCNGPDS